MVDKNKTAIALVVDRSGSMSSMRTDAQGGINTFIDDQRKQPGTASFKLVQFDDTIETVINERSMDMVKGYYLHPRGSTALLDAIGKTINELGAELRALPEEERPGQVIVAVMTDGGENSSREFTKDQISAMIKHQEENYNWSFIFLAANQDAISVGAGYGFTPSRSMTFAGANVGAAYASTSGLVSTLRSGVADAGYTDADRDAAVDASASS